jgi:hypothetical protein
MTEPTDQPYPAEPPTTGHPQESEPPAPASAQPTEPPPPASAQPSESASAVPPHPAEPPAAAQAYPAEPPTAALPYPIEPPTAALPYPGPYAPGGSPGPYPAEAYPGPYPPGGYPQRGLPPGPPAPRKRRTGLVVGIVLVIVLLLCAGGGVTAYVLVQNSQPTGAADPKAAVDGFLTAVFASHNAQEAADFVCPDARDDEQLEALVNQVTSFESQFDSPQTKWVTPPVQVDGKTGSATVKLELTTANEQVAEKQIRLLLVDRRGWWVCDVESAS